MKRLLCAALLASACAVPASAQEPASAKSQKNDGQAAARADRQKVKEGGDCDANRAGVRCSRPKPKKVWFFGKA